MEVYYRKLQGEQRGFRREIVFESSWRTIFYKTIFATFICTFTKSPSLFVLAAWQCKCKLGSYALRADNVDIFTVGLDDLFDD